MEDIEDKKGKAAFLIDTSVLQHMFEGKNEGQAGEVLKIMKQMKDSGVKGMKVVTPMPCFLRAIFLANPECKINDIQKTLSFLQVIPSVVDFKDEKATQEEMMKLAKLMAGEPIKEGMSPEERELWEKEK